MSNSPLIVVALGGNAITRPDQEGDVRDQFANSREAARPLADLIEQGHRLVITHGNGPQIGNFLVRNDAAAGQIYPLAMEVAVAHVQGGMGFMIAQTLTNELASRRRHDVVTAVITNVLVDRDDPSFSNPTKPIGRMLARADAEDYERRGWTVQEVEPGKFRRVVASPLPRRILENEHIRRAVEAGETLVVCGGGGIPVIRDPDLGLIGTRAVIDKDLASSLLARELDADAMLILTNVDRVLLDYGKPGERSVEKMSLDEAQAFMDEGQFPPGSMGPKVQGAIDFLRAGGKPDAFVTIGPLAHAADALAGRVGTRISK
jgi:carbamate kinase